MLKRLSYILLFLVPVLTMQGCGRNLEPQESCNFVQNSYAQRVSWKDSAPVKLYVHQSVDSKYYASIESAIKRWNEALGQNLLSIEAFGVSGPLSPNRDGNSIIYWMNTWEEGKDTEQARTTVYWSGNKIYEADIRINDKDFDFYTENEAASGVNFESLMIHELGHVLGLAHASEPSSVMYRTLANGVARTQIADLDKASLHCEY